MSTTLGLFVKHPEPGRVKTRLATSIGVDAATRLYAAFVTDLSNRFREVADHRVLAYSPGGSEAERYFSKIAGQDFALWPQPEGSLADRMESFFQTFGSERAVLIGSDSPTLPRAFVEQAFQKLEHHDVVLGPATDGGVYLIGLNGRRRRTVSSPSWPIFQSISWSTSRVLEELVDRIAEWDASLALLPPWYDVDDWVGLQCLSGHLQAAKLAKEPLVESLPATIQAVTDIQRGGSLYSRRD